MTRRQQYMARRNKFMQRRDRARNQSYTWAQGPLGPWQRVRSGKRHRWFHVGKQMPQRQSSATYEYTDDNTHIGGPATWKFHPIGKGLAPHVVYTGLWRLLIDAFGHHPRPALIGVHSRRVNHWPRKQGRRNGRDRRIMGASHFAFENGYFPDWDPLARHPTQQDVINGATPVTDYPHSPRGA